MRTGLLIAALLGGLALLVLLVGACLPRTHRAARSALFARTPPEIYAAIRDFAAMPAWRGNLTGVEILPPEDGHARFREVSRHGSVAYAVVGEDPPRSLVIRIADETLPYGGTWTYEISAAPEGSRLRITENGEVRNVLFRFMARFVFGHTATLEGYLRDLGRKFGENVQTGP